MKLTWSLAFMATFQTVSASNCKPNTATGSRTETAAAATTSAATTANPTVDILLVTLYHYEEDNVDQGVYGVLASNPTLPGSYYVEFTDDSALLNDFSLRTDDGSVFVRSGNLSPYELYYQFSNGETDSPVIAAPDALAAGLQKVDWRIVGGGPSPKLSCRFNGVDCAFWICDGVLRVKEVNANVVCGGTPQFIDLEVAYI